MRQVNAEGIALIKQWEGLRLTAYRDGGNVLTIGYGHTSAAGVPAVVAGMKISEHEAEEILKRDLAGAERTVNHAVSVVLNDNQFAALVSFVFNVGSAAFLRSTLLKKLNNGDYEAVPGELAKWVNDNGKRIPGLVNRRAAEAGLWARGAYVASRTASAEGKRTNPYVNKETLTMVGVPVATSALAAAANPGPLQWAVAAVIVAAAIVGAVFLISRIRERNA